MTDPLIISETTSIALHAVVLLAAQGQEAMSTRQIGQRLKVSDYHLSKVMQHLGRAGLVQSTRGPRGGFRLAYTRKLVWLVLKAARRPVWAGRTIELGK